MTSRMERARVFCDTMVYINTAKIIKQRWISNSSIDPEANNKKVTSPSLCHMEHKKGLITREAELGTILESEQKYSKLANPTSQWPHSLVILSELGKKLLTQ